MSKISIIIPCYNHGAYIQEAIDSVEQCADKDLYQIIIINDGSTDEYTNKILQNLKNNGYNVIAQAHQGLAKTRNEAIKIANSEYILTLDSDNKIAPDFIHKSIEILDTMPNIAVVYSDIQTFGIKKEYLSIGEFEKQRLLNKNYINACAIFRKTAWQKCGGYKEDMPYQGWEHWELWLTMLENNFNFFYIPQAMIFCRTTENSLTAIIQKDFYKRKYLNTYVFFKHLDLYKDYNDPITAFAEKKDIIEEHDKFVKQIRQTYSYKIGNTLLKPFSLLKRFKKQPIEKISQTHVPAATLNLSDIIYSQRYTDFFKNDILNFDKIRNSDKTVDIIIPAYNAFDYLEPLFKSLFDNTTLKHNILIIDDASTDARVIIFLEKIAAQKNNITLIKNNKNLGFVKTVNKGLQLTQNDVVILNTDVEVPQYWLQRLMYPIYNLPKVASVTPMSNASTITSFPNLLEDNDLFNKLNINEIDNVFKQINIADNIYIKTPTGVGFCMAMSRLAIQKVGTFDEKTFGKGYGEENDWCQHAIKQGFQNLIATNIFCFHNHGTSFTKKEKEELAKQNLNIIINKYPNYFNEINQTIHNPDYKIIRDITLVKLILQSAEKIKLIFNHNNGGGADHYIKEYMTDNKYENIFMMIKPHKINKVFTLEIFHNLYYLIFDFNKLEEIADIIHFFNPKIDEIIINELVTYPDIEKTIKIILEMKKLSKITFIAHDFYGICANFTLMDYNNQWCEGGNENLCEKCFANFKINDFSKISQWRERWNNLFTEIDTVIVFSNFTKNLYSRFYNVLNNKFLLQAMKGIVLRKVNVPKTNNFINIGIIGHIIYNKGAQIVQEMAEIIEQKNIHNIKITIIGNLLHAHKHNLIEIIGSYKINELPDLIEKHNITIFFMPSICGETYCRTIDEAMQMELDIAVFNIGAPPERVTKYHKGLIISKIDPLTALNEIIDYCK